MHFRRHLLHAVLGLSGILAVIMIVPQMGMGHHTDGHHAGHHADGHH